MPKRIAGLDILRALAIAMVLVAHYPKSGSGPVMRALNFGWAGVDLFFVLSGYLIAGQLFAAHASGKPISLQGFYVRRWLRTLPAYYAVLAVYVVRESMPVGRYVTFAQNLAMPDVFTPSWSLCVEEQFYLLFPLIAFFLIRRGDPKLNVIVVAAILALEVAIRGGVWFAVRPDLLPEAEALPAYMRYLYYPTWCRLDGITLGVGLAALKVYRPAIWQRVFGRAGATAAAGALFLGLAAASFWIRYSLVCSVFGFTFLSLSFALLTASIGQVSELPAKSAAVRHVALLSYSIYLTHSLAFQAGHSLITRLGFLFAGAVFLYYLVERPSLALRDRLLSPQTSRLPRKALLPVAEARN